MPEKLMFVMCNCSPCVRNAWPYFSHARVHLQVQDATGRWVDVVMQKNEVAIFLGATSTRATGGLLKAATTRVVRFL